jgi:hypothetical protein
MDVELQVGQTWLTRNGSKVELVQLDPADDDFPFQGGNFFWYTKTGRTSLSGGTRGEDLVELVSDVEQTPKPDVAPNGSLVERVATICASGSGDEPEVWDNEARAIIRDLAAAALQMAPDKNLTWERVALWLEREANHG